MGSMRAGVLGKVLMVMAIALLNSSGCHGDAPWRGMPRKGMSLRGMHNIAMAFESKECT